MGERIAAPGRPRRFDDAEELERLYAAALEVVRRKDYQDVTVADILAEAGMATRSFYRHFESKDELLRALYRRDAERVATALETRVIAAPSPRVALEVWIDEVVAIGHEGAKSRRAATLGSLNALRADGSMTEAQRALQRLVEPLVRVLEQGRVEGVFPAAEPQSDARMISAVAWDAAELGLPASRRGSRAEATRRVVAFSLRALGA